MKNVALLLLLVSQIFLCGDAVAEADAEEFNKTRVKWLGHAGFEITTPKGNVILIDPWLKNPKAPEGGFVVEKADLVLVTHGHFDHFGEASEIIQETGAHLVSIFELGMAAVAQKGVPPEKAGFGTLMNIGGQIKVFEGEVTIAMVQAAHSSGISHKIEDKDWMLYGGTSVGYVISVKNGPVIYHTGDTGLFGDMRLIRRMYEPTLLLVPIGDHFTMGPELAATAVKMIGAKRVIPMHYGTFPVLTGTPEQFLMETKKLNLSSEILVLQPGEEREFD